MTSNRWKAWRAQQPSSSFTERTVAAIVRERRRRFAFAPRRWAVATAMAAVLMGGAAWGLAGFPLRERPKPAPPAAVAADPTPRPPPRPVPAPVVEAPPPPAPPTAAPRRKETRPASSAPGRKVVVPRCFCSPKETICDCF
jgi:hypothetical protein